MAGFLHKNCSKASMMSQVLQKPINRCMFVECEALDQWFSTFFVPRPIIATNYVYNPMTPILNLNKAYVIQLCTRDIY